MRPIVGWRDSYELLPSKRPISSRWKGGNVHTLQVILHVCISLFFFFFSYISKETKGKKYTPVRSIIDFLLLLELLWDNWRRRRRQRRKRGGQKKWKKQKNWRKTMGVKLFGFLFLVFCFVSRVFLGTWWSSWCKRNDRRRLAERLGLSVFFFFFFCVAV